MLYDDSKYERGGQLLELIYRDMEAQWALDGDGEDNTAERSARRQEEEALFKASSKERFPGWMIMLVWGHNSLA